MKKKHDTKVNTDYASRPIR